MTRNDQLWLLFAGIAGALLANAIRPRPIARPAEKVIGSRDATACRYPRECRFPECTCELAGVPTLALPAPKE